MTAKVALTLISLLCLRTQRCAVYLGPPFSAMHGDKVSLNEVYPSLQVSGRTKSLFSTMKKLLRLDSIEAGGRSKEQVHDVLAARCIITPHPDVPPQEAEDLATQVELSAAVHMLLCSESSNQSDSSSRESSMLPIMPRADVAPGEACHTGRALCSCSRVAVQ